MEKFDKLMQIFAEIFAGIALLLFLAFEIYMTHYSFIFIRDFKRCSRLEPNLYYKNETCRRLFNE